MNTAALPANQKALADTFKVVRKGRRKPLRAYLADAEEVMTVLRQRGFRVVPFPPLKTLKARNKKVARRKRTLA